MERAEMENAEAECFLIGLLGITQNCDVTQSLLQKEWLTESSRVGHTGSRSRGDQELEPTLMKKLPLPYLEPLSPASDGAGVPSTRPRKPPSPGSWPKFMPLRGITMWLEAKTCFLVVTCRHFAQAHRREKR